MSDLSASTADNAQHGFQSPTLAFIGDRSGSSSGRDLITVSIPPTLGIIGNLEPSRRLSGRHQQAAIF